MLCEHIVNERLARKVENTQSSSLEVQSGVFTCTDGCICYRCFAVIGHFRVLTLGNVRRVMFSAGS